MNTVVKPRINCETDLICPNCKKVEIAWKEVYYKENERLIKPEKLQLGWCSKCNNYILK